jgi:hypothetical protein
MRVPSLPGGFLDVLSYFDNGGASGSNLAGVPIPGYDTALGASGPGSRAGSGAQTPLYQPGQGQPGGGLSRSNSGMNADLATMGGRMQMQGQAQMPGYSGGAPLANILQGPLQGAATGNVLGQGQAVGSGALASALASADMTRSNSGGKGSREGKGKGKEVGPLGNLSRM